MTKLQTRALLVAALLVASLGLVGLNQSGVLQPVKSALVAPLTALQRGLARAWGGAAGLFQRDPDAEALRQRNAELEQQVAQLKAQVVQLQENQADFKIVSGLLNYARSQPDNRYLAASVIGRDTSPFLGYLILDQGSDAGVTRGMPVITDQGLVGHIVEVTSSISKVQLIADSTSAVNAFLQKSRERGVVTGQLAGGLELRYISQQVVVEPGELVLTSGLGGSYPRDIVIGTVTAVQKLNYEVLQKADVTPAVDFNRLEIVLIITSFTPVDFSPLLQATPAPAPPAP